MDSYEVERIAADAAYLAADNVRRDLEYRLDELRRDVDSLNRALDEEIRNRREACAILSEALASVGG